MDVTPVIDGGYSNWLFGGLGAITNVLLSKKDGQPFNPYQACGTLISGCVLAGTGGTVGSMAGMGTISVSLSAFFAGMVGVNIAKRVLKKSNDLSGDSK